MCKLLNNESNISTSCVSSSIEIIFANDSREIIFGFPLCWSSKSLESRKGFRIMDTFFEEIKFWLAYSHLPFHLEHAFTCIIKRLQTNWFELQVLWMATKQIECFWFRVFRVSLIHWWSCSLFFIVNNLATAFIKVHVKEYHLLKCDKLRTILARRHVHMSVTYLDIWHVIDPFQIEIDFMPSSKYGHRTVSAKILTRSWSLYLCI